MSADPVQRDRALERANLTRRLRAAEKRRLRAAEYPDSLRVAMGHVLSPPAHLAGMSVGALLVACRGVRDAKVNRILFATRIASNRTLGQLGASERRRVADAIEGWIARLHPSVERAA